MSLASDWAAAAVVADAEMQAMEATSPPTIAKGEMTLRVTRTGGLNVSGPSSVDFTADEALALAAWVTTTFGEPV